jgi:pyruvate-ferredoxin/flavodoxin oxidoreductase
LTNKKDLGAIAMNYDNVYIASIAMGANYQQTLTAIKEAEAYKGPSLDYSIFALHKSRHRHE